MSDFDVGSGMAYGRTYGNCLSGDVHVCMYSGRVTEHGRELGLTVLMGLAR